MPKPKKTPEAKFVESMAELFTPDQLSRIMYALVSLRTMEKLKTLKDRSEDPTQWDAKTGRPFQ